MGKPKETQPQKQQQQQQSQKEDVKNVYDGPPFSALDIRVGYIKNAYPHPEADKLYVEEIDLNESSGEPRTICSGLRPYFQSADELIGKKVLVLCNLKSRNMVGIPSHGMVLCASSSDGTQVKFVNPPQDAIIGERVILPSCYQQEEPEGEPFSENKIGKKKIFQKIQPFLKTDKYTGTATFSEQPFLT